MNKEFNLDAFKAFVASKPASAGYNATDYDLCALGQFGFNTHLCECEERGIPAEVYVAAAYETPTTFGALSERLSRLSPNPTGRG